MTSTIDSGGRVVIPKPIRDRLGLQPGTTVEIAEHEGHVEIAPVETPIQLLEVDGRLVARSTEELPPLTDEIVRDTLEQTRR